MMYIIFIVVLLAICLLMTVDTSWSNVLTSARNAMVFDGRHQDYGAFELRRDYVRRLAVSFAGSVLFLGAAVSVPKIVAALGSGDEVTEAKKIVDVDLALFEEEKKEEPPPPPVEPPPPVKIETVQFTELVAEDEPVEEPPPTQETLTETTASTETQEGVKEDVPPPPVVEEVTFELSAVEEQPEFPGGLEAMYKFLQKNTVFPEIEKEAGNSGKVYVEFVVANDGDITDVTLKRGVSGGLDKEALRVVKSMPKWTPGKMNGKPVKVRYILPVNFKLQ